MATNVPRSLPMHAGLQRMRRVWFGIGMCRSAWRVAGQCLGWRGAYSRCHPLPGQSSDGFRSFGESGGDGRHLGIRTVLVVEQGRQVPQVLRGNRNFSPSRLLLLGLGLASLPRRGGGQTARTFASAFSLGFATNRTKTVSPPRSTMLSRPTGRADLRWDGLLHASKLFVNTY